MIIAKLRGGLGNQMFIYAFARYLAHKHNVSLKLDTSYYDNYHRTYELNKFKIIESFASQEEIDSLKTLMYRDNLFLRIIKKNILNKELKKKPSKTYILDNGIEFKSEYMKLNPGLYLEGLFQSEKFFIEIEDIIRNEFTLNQEIDDRNKYFLNKIQETNSISLHVRRGDYITNQWANEQIGLCAIEYYQKAVNHMINNVENPHFYLFSDDIEWTKENLKIDSSFTVIDCNDETNAEKDLILMNKCKHHICANSSFSWWGAWLGENKNKIIIAPEKWMQGNQFDYKDVIPESWIKID